MALLCLTRAVVCRPGGDFVLRMQPERSFSLVRTGDDLTHMATFVLVHGSYQGGWIWKFVAQRLEAAGHHVYRPTLEGSAERRRTLSPTLSLADYGAEIADLFFYEDLRDVVFVGTSIGGMVVCQAAEQVPERIQRIIFIEALVPLPGETVPTINSRPPYPKSNVVYGPKPEDAGSIFTDLPAETQAWAVARYTQQAIAPTDDPVDLHAFWARAWQVDVLRCTRSPAPPEAHQRRTAERLRGTYTELDAGHYPMLSHPAEVTAYLLERC
jgi:pimeloyl-ACP methyl ester carboxylesterase